MRFAGAAAVMLVLASGTLALEAGCGAAPLTRDERAEALLKENRRLEDLLVASEQRVTALQAAGVKPMPQPTKVEDPFRAVAVRFGKTTDVIGLGGKTDDERLKVVVEPQDAEGDTVKRAGALELDAFEVVPGGTKLYGLWKFTPEEMAKAWLSGLGTYAYVLKFPWPDGKPPQGNKLSLKARFTTLDGDVFTAEATLTIDRPAGPAKESAEKAVAPPEKPAKPSRPAKGPTTQAAPAKAGE